MPYTPVSQLDIEDAFVKVPDEATLYNHLYVQPSAEISVAKQVTEDSLVQS